MQKRKVDFLMELHNIFLFNSLTIRIDLSMTSKCQCSICILMIIVNIEADRFDMTREFDGLSKRYQRNIIVFITTCDVRMYCHIIQLKLVKSLIRIYYQQLCVHTHIDGNINS